MKKIIFLLIISTIIFNLSSCNKAEEPKTMQASKGSENIAPVLPVATPGDKTLSAPVKPMPADIIAEVDGKKMSRAELDDEVKKKMKDMEGKIPKEQLAKANAAIRKQVIDDFIVQTLLLNEVTRRKLVASDQEIASALESMRDGLPPGVTMDAFIKKSGLTKERLRQEIAMGIKINKLVEGKKTAKALPTDKEINEFYNRNKDKFKIPESVHVRHILVSKIAGEDDKAKAKKRDKAESLRKQLLSGSDFAELAKKNSDCPSKSLGGDLGGFTRGQMVKTFENAAFAQKKNEIGPVVETEYGYHIIQVLDHEQTRTQPLDGETKNKIAAFLKQKKKYDAFNEIMTALKAKAHIAVAEF